MEIHQQPPVVPLGGATPALVNLSPVSSPGVGPRFSVGYGSAAATVVDERLVLPLSASTPRLHLTGRVEPAQLTRAEEVEKRLTQFGPYVVTHQDPYVRAEHLYELPQYFPFAWPKALRLRQPLLS